jgi:hypothetical protein
MQQVLDLALLNEKVKDPKKLEIPAVHDKSAK